MAPIFEEKGVEFVVEYVQSVRNWKASLPQVADLSGAYRKRDKKDERVIPHSFTFVQRSRTWSQDNKLRSIFHIYCQLDRCVGFSCLSGMPSTLLNEAHCRLPRRFQPRGNDVFCLVKAFVSDSGLSQPALLVLPGDTIETVSTAVLNIAEGHCSRNLSNIDCPE